RRGAARRHRESRTERGWCPGGALSRQIEEDLPAFCWFYHLAPDAVRQLTFRDYVRMTTFLREAIQQTGARNA
ncbi:MAG: hypothetical protein ABR548_03620, partial [Actinomycetota bacterium]